MFYARFSRISNIIEVLQQIEKFFKDSGQNSGQKFKFNEPS